jgi:hypothetical protein
MMKMLQCIGAQNISGSASQFIPKNVNKCSNMIGNLKWSYPQFPEAVRSGHVMAVWPIKCLSFCLFTNFAYKISSFILSVNLGEDIF